MNIEIPDEEIIAMTRFDADVRDFRRLLHERADSVEINGNFLNLLRKGVLVAHAPCALIGMYTAVRDKCYWYWPSALHGALSAGTAHDSIAHMDMCNVQITDYPQLHTSDILHCERELVSFILAKVFEHSDFRGVYFAENSVCNFALGVGEFTWI